MSQGKLKVREILASKFKSHHLFLFDDLLLIAARRKEETYRLAYKMKLCECTVEVSGGMYGILWHNSSNLVRL